ncbi:Hypothetical protein A7982_11511 [Minicystis rosea]|nr:Hypothetical protein A7982_11511 [Minicystis rosea]
MLKRTVGFGLAATLIAGAGAFFFSSAPAKASEGADLHIHNKTGTSVEVYIFEDDKVHKDRSGGLHSGDLKDGETGTAHVKACKFSIVLFHEKDAYHAEFHDCHITDITITGSNK